jgi:group I intron endonuclease
MTLEEKIYNKFNISPYEIIYNISQLDKYDGVSGVYAILWLHDSDNQPPLYIGGSKNIKRRFQAHRTDLACKRNKNRVFQGVYNAHPKKNIYVILETCERGMEIKLEQKYLDFYRPFVDEGNGLNVLKEAFSAPPTPKGRKLSEETKEKLRQINLGRKFTNTPEARERIAAANRLKSQDPEIRRKISEKAIGRKHSPDTILKMSNTRNKINIQKRTKDLFITLFLQQAGVEKIRDLSKSDKNKLYKVLNKISVKTHRELQEDYFKKNKKEKPKRTQGEGQKERRSKLFKLLSPDNILYEGRNIAKFCRLNGLGAESVRQLILKKKKSYKGWTIPA